VPALAFAQLTIGLQNPIKSNSVAEVMATFFNVLVQLGAVAVVLAIVYAGFLFVVSKGNPEELKKAKTTLFWTIIGALILLGAQVIASVIKNTLSSL
jgi:heme/copper-type cytochrome/quinol oxidase subunit 2